METYNLRTYSNGRIVKKVNAENRQKAQDILETKGFDCQDDHFLESESDTAKESVVLPYRSTYTPDYQSEY